MLTLADFSLGDLLIALIWIFFLVVFFWLLITVFSDLWRDKELSGWAKALWVIFVIVFPFLGILIYLIARGDGMTERAMQEQARTEQYIRQVSGGGGSAEELAKLAELKEKGAISEDEFNAMKAKILA